MAAPSILENSGVLAADNTIKFEPNRSITKFRIGDEIDLNDSTFARLSSALFNEIATKCVK